MIPKVGEWLTMEKQPLVRKRRKPKEPYKVLTKICYVYLISFARLSAASSFLVCQQSRILLSTGAKSSSIRVTFFQISPVQPWLVFQHRDRMQIQGNYKNNAATPSPKPFQSAFIWHENPLTLLLHST